MTSLCENKKNFYKNWRRRRGSSNSLDISKKKYIEGPPKAIISTRGRSAAAFAAAAAAAAFSLVACAQSTAIGLRSWRKYYVEAIYTALLSPQRPPRLLASTIEAVSWASKSRYKYTPASSPRVIAATARLFMSGTVRPFLFFYIKLLLLLPIK